MTSAAGPKSIGSLEDSIARFCRLAKSDGSNHLTNQDEGSTV